MLSHETSRDRETGRPGDRETGNHPPVVCILINTTTFISPNGTDCQLLIPKRGGEGICARGSLRELARGAALRATRASGCNPKKCGAIRKCEQV